MGWRVGSLGLRVFREDGSMSWLPPGSVLDELPASYVGEVERTSESVKRHPGYADKAITPPEDKSL